MGRMKIVMEPINNDKKRKITFSTRKQGLVKKARELATLCDVDVSMIICTDDQEHPEIFPPDPRKLDSLIDVYKHNRGLDPGRVKFYILSDFYMDRKIKIEEELVKAKKKNLEAKYPSWFDFLNNFSESRLREFAIWLESKIVDVKSRIESVKKVSSIEINQVGYNNNFVVDPVAGLYGVESYYPIAQSLYPDSLLNEGDNVVYDGEYFSLQPPSMEQFLMSGFPSQVMKNTRANGTGIYDYYFK